MALGIIVGRTGANGYMPPLVHRLLKPRRLGNLINGWGEKTFRRPTPIYHWVGTPNVTVAFQKVQSFFYFRDMMKPVFRRLLNEAVGYLKIPPAPIAPVRIDDTPENWTARVKTFVLANEGDMAGVTAFTKDWLFEGFDADYPNIVVIGVRMDDEKLQTAPGRPSNEDVLGQYNRGQRAAMKLRDWIRAQGYRAEGHCGPSAAKVSLIPAALAAGFGELGKHGSVISRSFGSSFRLASVLTDMPLVHDRPDDLGVDEFCASCRLCSSECPPMAIYPTKQMVRGERKWFVNFDLCVPYFNDTFGCAICLKVCPWGKPGVAPILAQKMLKKRAAKAKAAA